MRRLALVLVLFGCTPRIPEGLTCTTNDDCPPMQTCDLHGHCGSGSSADTGVDAGASIDVGPHDAPALDTGIDAPASDAGVDAFVQPQDTGVDAGAPAIGFAMNYAATSSIGTPTCLTIGDYDDDGHLDIVAGGTTGAAFVYSASASDFTPALTLSMPIIDCTTHDIDGDHIDDLVSLSGSALQVTHGAQPSRALIPSPGPSGLATPRFVTMASLGADTKLDVVVSTVNDVEVYTSSALNNDGQRLFESNVRVYGIAALGVTGSGFFGLSTTSGTHLYATDGMSEAVSSDSFLPSGTPLTMPIMGVVRDLNADTHEDFVLLRGSGTTIQLVILLQGTTGAFSATSVPMPPGATGVAVGNVVGDSALELIVSHHLFGAGDLTRVYSISGTLLGTLASDAGVQVTTAQFRTPPGHDSIVLVSDTGRVSVLTVP